MTKNREKSAIANPKKRAIQPVWKSQRFIVDSYTRALSKMAKNRENPTIKIFEESKKNERVALRREVAG